MGKVKELISFLHSLFAIIYRSVYKDIVCKGCSIGRWVACLTETPKVSLQYSLLPRKQPTQWKKSMNSIYTKNLHIIPCKNKCENLKYRTSIQDSCSQIRGHNSNKCE